MEEAYILNEKLKRLAPKETLCQYCKKDHSTDVLDNYYCPAYKEKDRTNVVVYRSVKFNKIKVGIPRCKSCKAIHSKSKVISGPSFS